jgi:hypothetical protein
MGEQILTLNSIISRSPDLVFSEVDDEIVMLGIETGNYYGLDKILSQMWLMIEEPGAISSIIDDLLTQYDVDRSQCEQDVFNVLNRMLKDQLIQIS